MMEMNTNGVANAYARLAPIYDFVFGPVFRRGRAQAVKVAERIGGRILEVGVGTGLSLPQYAAATSIVGVDISEPMLEVARKRVARLGLANVESIEIGDAQNLRFPDNSFDVVVAQYVVTACPNPEESAHRVRTRRAAWWRNRDHHPYRRRPRNVRGHREDIDAGHDQTRLAAPSFPSLAIPPGPQATRASNWSSTPLCRR